MGVDPSPPGRRPRGRPRSEASRRAVLRAATQILEAGGIQAFTVDGVARRSGVSKATIYRHWDNALDIAAEAFGERVTAAMPVPSTGDAIADITEQLRRVAAVYASPLGRVTAQLLAAGVTENSSSLREAFFGERRRATAAMLAKGAAAGQLRPGFDPELLIDFLFGPIVFRVLNAGEPFSADDAAMLADLALRGLAQGRVRGAGGGSD